MGLLNLDVLTATGEKLSTVLDWWETSERRQAVRSQLTDPDQVIMDADSARKAGLSSTVVFPTGNIAPEGSVIKATAIDPSVVDEHEVYHHRGRARVFASEKAAVRAIKGQAENPVQPHDVVVLIGVGPSGTGMEETYQVTSALKFIPWGKTVSVLTDARFSGVSTGACVGHIGPEALAGGPVGKLRDGDILDIRIDRKTLTGSINLVGTLNGDITSEEADHLLSTRPPHPDLQPHPDLPDDTRLWAALQEVSGGTWAGCVYDTDRIITILKAGTKALQERGVL
jgi:dihydroxyacid dehydratase/phosphogluconate dehydratase